MPRIRSKDAYFYTVAVSIIATAICILVCLIKWDIDHTFPNELRTGISENHIQLDSKTQATLDSMARAFNKWDR